MRILVDPTQAVEIYDRSRLFGISIDADQLPGDYHTSCVPDLENPVVRNLCAELKPATFRVGGYGIQKAYFVESDPDATASVPWTDGYTIDCRKCAAIADFCNYVGCELMMSLPLLFGDIDNAGQLAEAMIHGTDVKCGFIEMDNEPDWGWKNGTMTLYPELVTRCYEALSAKFPDQEWIAGYGGRDFPHGVCHPDSTPYMDLIERCGEFIDVFCAHYYRTSSNRRFATGDLLLDEIGADIGFARVKELRLLLRLHNLQDKKIAINEFNSFAVQGLDGVSNTMRAALWLADFMGHLARNAVYVSNVQASFAKEHHGSRFWRYAMIDTREKKPFVNPHYYAFYLWTRLMGNRVLPTASPPLHPLSVHVTTDEDDFTRIQIMAINKDVRSKADISVRILDAVLDSEVLVYCLCADSPESRNASINGVAAKDDGTVPSVAPQKLGSSVKGDTATLSLPPSSVTVAHLRII